MRDDPVTENFARRWPLCECGYPVPPHFPCDHEEPSEWAYQLLDRVRGFYAWAQLRGYTA